MTQKRTKPERLIEFYTPASHSDEPRPGINSFKVISFHIMANTGSADPRERGFD